MQAPFLSLPQLPPAVCTLLHFPFNHSRSLCAFSRDTARNCLFSSFFYSKKAQKFPFSVTMGEYCPVLQLCPTFPQPVPVPVLVFWIKRALPTSSGAHPSWQQFWGETCTQLVVREMGLCIPRMFWTMNWFYWSLSYCWFVFPVSINSPEEQHTFFSAQMWKFLGFHRNLSVLTSHLQLLAFSLLSLAIFLVCRRAGISQGQRLCGSFAP